jgi:phosphatidylinositol-3-phosphatase
MPKLILACPRRRFFPRKGELRALRWLAHAVAVKKFLVIALAVVVGACAATTPERSSATLSSMCGSLSTHPAHYGHVIWIWFENKSYSQVIGNSSAPYLNRLAKRCGLATHFHAIRHPSLPNYIAATSGSTQGITDDAGPSSHPLRVRSIFSQVRAAGYRWRSIEESMPAACYLWNSGEYAVRHNPAAYYGRIRTICRNSDTPSLTAWHRRFTFVTPNVCHDMHDCSVATGDAWLRRFLPRIVSSHGYQHGRTAIFIVWDEGDYSSSNRVPLLVISPYTPAGKRVSTSLTHYSLLRSTESMLGLRYLGKAATANGLRAGFHL